MSLGFYRAFEERYYAPRETIKTLRRQYLPFVSPLCTIYPHAKAFDIGCGRGEWLELMTEAGLNPYGVDLDAGMLDDCIKHGLRAEKGDAISYLSSLPSESQAIVSAFHVVEHISFDQLRTLVSEALRVLVPGGLLIMETPNPENIVVATRNFYLDPTHQRPIPAELLSFLPEYYGFKRVKTLRLQESPELFDKKDVTLFDVFSGVSPDYAVVAQKDAENDILELTVPAFYKDYGLTLDQLSDNYDKKIADISQVTASKLSQLELSSEQSASISQELETRLARSEEKASKAIQHISEVESRVSQLETKASNISAELNAVYASSSWRITSPLRWLKIQARLIYQQGAIARSKALLRKALLPLLRRANRYVAAHPTLRSRLLVFAQRLGLDNKARSLYRKLNNANGLHPADTPKTNHDDQLQNLTPHTRKLYSALTMAIRNKDNR